LSRFATIGAKLRGRATRTVFRFGDPSVLAVLA
jgi:hypothetical protein